jgi:hypothetical protein
VLNHEKKVEELISRAKEYYPEEKLALCIYFMDIKKNLLESIRSYNLPIFTLGSSLSYNFVDRFYNLLRNFKYAASLDSGSQLYLATELGIDYKLLGERSIFYNHKDPNLPIGEMEFCHGSSIRKKYIELEEKLFRNNENNFDEKYNYACYVVGKGNDSKELRDKLRNLFLFEVIRLFPLFFMKFIYRISNFQIRN